MVSKAYPCPLQKRGRWRTRKPARPSAACKPYADEQLSTDLNKTAWALDATANHPRALGGNLQRVIGVPASGKSEMFQRPFSRSRRGLERLTCISHHPTVEARDTTAMTSLRLLAVLNVRFKRAKRLAPRPDGPLTHFTSPRGEKCRLAAEPRGKEVSQTPLPAPCLWPFPTRSRRHAYRSSNSAARMSLKSRFVVGS